MIIASSGRHMPVETLVQGWNAGIREGARNGPYIRTENLAGGLDVASTYLPLYRS